LPIFPSTTKLNSFRRMHGGKRSQRLRNMACVMREKQRVRAHYSVLEKQFAANDDGEALQGKHRVTLQQLLETRLDTWCGVSGGAVGVGGASARGARSREDQRQEAGRCVGEGGSRSDDTFREKTHKILR